MTFNIFSMQQQILDRLAPLAGGIPVHDTFTQVDFTDSFESTVAAKTAFLEFSPEGQVGRSARHYARWSFDLFVDLSRVTDPEKAAAMAFYSAAMGGLIGWDFSPGLEVHTSPGQESGLNGHVLRISFGFTIPVYLAG